MGAVFSFCFSLHLLALSDGQVASLEASSEEQYREGLGRVADPAHLWAAYIQWCQERTEDPHLQDGGRIRVRGCGYVCVCAIH